MFDRQGTNRGRGGFEGAVSTMVYWLEVIRGEFLDSLIPSQGLGKPLSQARQK